MADDDDDGIEVELRNPATTKDATPASVNSTQHPLEASSHTYHDGGTQREARVTAVLSH